MSDDNLKLLLQLATALGVFLGPVVLALLNWLTARKVADKAETVRKVLANTNASTDKKLTSISTTTNAVHTLVNSAMSEQLKLNAIISRRLANITKNPADDKAAIIAERMSEEHELKQQIIDRNKKITPPGDHP